MANIEDERVTRFEVSGLIIGVVIGTAVPVWGWYSWGRHQVAMPLFWGIPLNYLAFPAGFIGAFLGIWVGNSMRNFKIK